MTLFGQFTEEEIISIAEAFSSIGINYDEALKAVAEYCNKVCNKKDKEDSK